MDQYQVELESRAHGLPTSGDAGDSAPGSKRLRIDQPAAVNTLQLVAKRNLPLSCEELILEFLSFDSWGGLTTVSKDMYSVLQAFYSRLKSFGGARAWDAIDAEAQLQIEAGISLLRCCTRLESLDFNSTWWIEVPEDWKAAEPIAKKCILKNQATLESVGLFQHSLSSLAALATCTRLKEFTDTGLRDSTNASAFRAAVIYLAESVPTLTELRLGESDYEGEAGAARYWLNSATIARVLNTVTDLRTLELRNVLPRVSPLLARHTALQSLELSQHASYPLLFADLSAVLPKLTALESLDIVSSHETKGVVLSLPPSVRKLRLAGNDSPRIVASGLRDVDAPLDGEQLLAVVSSNHSLTRLIVSKDSPLDHQTAEMLSDRTGLTRLSLASRTVPDSMLRCVKQLSSLTQLNLWLPTATHPRDLTFLLVALPRLQQCRLFGSAFAAKLRLQLPVAATSSTHHSLTELSAPLCDDSLLQLQLPSLRSLHLESRNVTLANLAEMLRRCCPLLTSLELSSLPDTALNDRSLVPALRQVPALTSLTLQRCAISVMSLVNIATLSLCPRLQSLIVHNCFEEPEKQVDSEVGLALLSALPKLYRLSADISDTVRTKLREKAKKLGKQWMVLW